MAKTPASLMNRRLCIIVPEITHDGDPGDRILLGGLLEGTMDGFAIDHNRESFPDVAEMLPYDIGINMFLAPIVVTSPRTLISPRFAMFSVVTLVLTFILSYIPFNHSTRFGVVNEVGLRGRPS